MADNQSLRKRCLIYLSAFCLSNVIIAQSQKDFALLGQISAQKNITSNWSAGIAFQSMIYENATEMRNFYTTLSVGYQPFKRWSFSAAYRFSFNKLLNNNYENRQRFMFDVNYENNLARKLSFDWRSRVQRQHYGLALNDERNYKPSRIYWRNRIGLQYSFNWYWKMGGNIEIFYPLNHPKRQYIDQIRLQADVTYRRSRNHSYKLFYQIRQPIDQSPATTRFILGANYAFKF